MFDFTVLRKYLIEYNGYKDVLAGLLATIEIAVLGLIIGIVIGILIAVIKIIPQNNRFIRVLRKICDIYVAIFRGTPIVVQLLVFYYGLPSIIGINIDCIPCSIMVFGLNSGAYVSEIMRGGILSVDAGQMEAGRSLGLKFYQTMFSIILPQAIKNIIPTLGNEFISLVKETSIVSFVTVMDVTKAFQDFASSSYDYFTFYITLALIYLVIVLLITLLIRIIEAKNVILSYFRLPKERIYF